MSLFSKTNSILSLVLDLGSESVGAALVLKESERVPIILNTAREELPIHPNFDFSRTKKEVLNLLDKVCEKILRESGAKPKEIKCVLNAPFAYGELRFANIDRGASFVFTEKLGMKIAAGEIDAYKRELSEKDALIDKKITKVSLNGFNTEKPYGKRAKTARVDIFLSVAEKKFLNDVEDKIHKTFKAKIEFTSEMFSDFVAVRNIFDVENDFLILNVGGEVTEVSVMKEDILVGTGYFPYGASGIIRDTAKLLNKNIYETKSLLLIYDEGHLGSSLKKIVEKNLEICLMKWQKELKKVLAAIVPSRQIPSNTFLLAPKSFEKMISLEIDSRNFREFTTLHENFNVIIGDTKVLHPFCDFTHTAERDSSLTLKTIFISQI